uniref:Uncharacterized protein n=1 Tax=Rhizophora mucronata TaxID=61149 RepID=A0A2P2KIP1_RHIMU
MQITLTIHESCSCDGLIRKSIGLEGTSKQNMEAAGPLRKLFLVVGFKQNIVKNNLQRWFLQKV